MPKARVLMLGWEFPPHINGGLGVACEGLARSLAELTSLGLILPTNTAPLPCGQVEFIEKHHSAHPSYRALTSIDLIPADLRPYLNLQIPDDHQDSLYQGELGTKVLDFATRAAAQAQEREFDLIHAHDWMTAVAGLEIRKRTGKPLVFHVHSLSYDRAGPGEAGWIHQLEKSAIQQADLVIAVSHYSRQICLQRYQADPKKTVVVHNGITPFKTYRSPKPFKEKLVVFLGRMTSQKSPGDFLKIARLVLQKNPKVRFAMAGKGEQLRALMTGSRRMGIFEKLHFTGFLNRRKVHELLSMADVYCMPSASEPFGLSALEAALFGVPMVLSKQSGAAEILTSAYTAEAGNTESMARGVLTQLEDGINEPPAKLRNWHDAAREILQHYARIIE